MIDFVRSISFVSNQSKKKTQTQTNKHSIIVPKLCNCSANRTNKQRNKQTNKQTNKRTQINKQINKQINTNKHSIIVPKLCNCSVDGCSFCPEGTYIESPCVCLFILLCVFILVCF
jgi:hypothetical protein